VFSLVLDIFTFFIALVLTFGPKRKNVVRFDARNNQALSAIEPFRKYLLSSACDVLLLENNLGSFGKKASQKQTDETADRSRKREQRARTTTGTTAQANSNKHEEILRFSNTINNSSNTNQSDHRLANRSINARAPAMTRERRAEVANANKDACLGKELRRVLRTLSSGEYDAFPPTELLKAVWKFVPAFAGSAQQDAHEFARFALERLRKELLLGERMARKREEAEKMRIDVTTNYNDNKLIKIEDYQGVEKYQDDDEGEETKRGGRRRNDSVVADDDENQQQLDFETQERLLGKVPKRARSFRPRPGNVSLTTSPAASKEGSPSFGNMNQSMQQYARISSPRGNVMKNGSGGEESYLLDVDYRQGAFLSPHINNEDNTPTLGFLNIGGGGAYKFNPFQFEVDEKHRQQKSRRMLDGSNLLQSSESVNTKDGLFLAMNNNNNNNNNSMNMNNMNEEEMKGFTIVSRWGAVDHKFGCTCRPCKAQRLKFTGSSEVPLVVETKDRSTQTTQIVDIKMDDDNGIVVRDSNTPSVTNDPSPPEKAPRIMALKEVMNMKSPAKLTPVRTQKRGVPSAVQKLVDEAKMHMVVESPKFDPTTPHTYFADAEHASNDPIWKIFGGVSISHVKCNECGQSNAMKEPFLDLSLPLPNVYTRPQTRATSPPLVTPHSFGNSGTQKDGTFWDYSTPIDGNGPNGEATIEQCLEAHTREESLGGSNGEIGNRYYCERCQAVTSATKRTSLDRRCPKVLVLHLKRFTWRGKTGQRAKICAPIAFPLENLSLEPFLEPFFDDAGDDVIVINDDEDNDNIDEAETPSKKMTRARGGKSSSRKGINSTTTTNNAKKNNTMKQQRKTSTAKGDDNNIDNEKALATSYDLSACVAHHGQHANAGHYTAVCRDLNGDNIWRAFDDDKVRIIDEDELKSIASQGYMFFYVRRNADVDDCDEIER